MASILTYTPRVTLTVSPLSTFQDTITSSSTVILSPLEARWTVVEIKQRVLPLFELTYLEPTTIYVTHIDTLTLQTTSLLLKVLEELPLNLYVHLQATKNNLLPPLLSRINQIHTYPAPESTTTSIQELLKKIITGKATPVLVEDIISQLVQIGKQVESTQVLEQIISTINLVRTAQLLNTSPSLLTSYLLSTLVLVAKTVK